MSRFFALAALGLALLGLGAGLVDPQEPFEPNHLFVVDGTAVLREFQGDGVGVPALLTGPTPLTGLIAGRDLAFGPDGALYVSDGSLDRVLVYRSSGGGPLQTLGADVALEDPTALLFDDRGRLLVASDASDSVLRFARDGSLDLEIGASNNLANPRGMALGPDGRLFVSAFATDTVKQFAPDGELLDEIDSDLDGPWGLALGSDGRLYVANHGADTIGVFVDGALVESLGAGTGLDGPTALAFGPDGNLWVASRFTNLVLVLDTDGALVRTVGTGAALQGPTGLAFSPFVLGAKLKGDLALPGVGTGKLKSDARLSWAPGSGRAHLLLVDPDDALGTTFGDDVLGFAGFGATTPDGKLTSFVGTQVLGGAQGEGTGALGLEFKGDRDDVGFFVIKNGKGALHRSSPDGAALASVGTKSKLP